MDIKPSFKTFYDPNEESDDDEVRRSYNPLSFFMRSTAYRPFTITVNNSFRSKMLRKNYIPLSRGSTIKISKNNIMSSSAKVNKSSSESKFSRNFIHDDLLVSSILSKLPVKSLKLFGCVRKSWSTLFENSDFMTIYSNHFISRHGSDDHYHTFLLARHNELPLTPGCCLFNSEFHLLGNTLKFNLPSPFQHSCTSFCILGSTSVNGIFCFGQEDSPQNKVQYVLWNPATDESRVIPPSINERKPHFPQNKLCLNYAFHGFGYDQVRDDFKVIQFVSLDKDGPSPYSKGYFEIYSLKTNSWRMISMKIDLSSCHFFPSFYGCEAYVDGVCHWLVTQPNSDDRYGVELTLLSFDLSDEAFITTSIGEESFSPYTYNRLLTVLNGSIALVSNYDDDIVFHIAILGELGVTEAWIKLYICGPLPSIKWLPSGFGKTGYMFFTKTTDGELAYIDLSTKQIEEVGITGGDSSHFTVGLYKKSLFRSEDLRSSVVMFLCGTKDKTKTTNGWWRQHKMDTANNILADMRHRWRVQW
ncbi:F-box/kelch-repeat protein At3g06240-like [Vicia villosa]|uniref:F-box/kelch-repeat protein At3g06240-like n=1 Tax=Vicia villosa TaxID=3911 RepID=UPI00273B8AFD|nr:F-box/kelch-repeat protein At3g06240-like [Vicia villosa]